LPMSNRVDQHGPVVGFSILGVSRFRKERLLKQS
jgi:hypothetical protein